MSLISDEDAGIAEEALKALAPYRFSTDLLEQVEAAVKGCKSKKVRQVFEAKFRRNE